MSCATGLDLGIANSLSVVLFTKRKKKENGEKKEEEKTQFEITLLHMYRHSDSLMEGCEEAVCSMIESRIFFEFITTTRAQNVWQICVSFHRFSLANDKLRKLCRKHINNTPKFCR